MASEQCPGRGSDCACCSPEGHRRHLSPSLHNPWEPMEPISQLGKLRQGVPCSWVLRGSRRVLVTAVPVHRLGKLRCRGDGGKLKSLTPAPGPLPHGALPGWQSPPASPRAPGSGSSLTPCWALGRACCASPSAGALAGARPVALSCSPQGCTGQSARDTALWEKACPWAQADWGGEGLRLTRTPWGHRHPHPTL